MESDQSARVEVWRIRRLLHETARLAREASLTGSLKDGARASAQQYNAILQYLEGAGEVPPGLFQPLPETVNFDEVGVAAAQLEGYLGDADTPPPPPPPDPHRRVPHAGRNRFSNPFGSMPDLDELLDMGQKIRDQVVDQLAREREHLMRQIHPDWAERPRPTPPAPPTPPPPAPPTPPTPPTPPAPPPPPATPTLRDIEGRLADIETQLQAVAEQLRRHDLSDDERAALADQLARLSHEQADLIRHHATLRGQQP